MNDLKIAFISSHRFEDGAAIRGAVLVADYDTKPLEFRVTAPIRPTFYQKTLYGELLELHILVELIALPLIVELKEKPQIILVRDPIFLGINDKQMVPTILILKEDEPLFGKNIPTEQLDSANSEHPSLILKTSENFSNELNSVQQQLQSIYSRRNILEPFSRNDIACQEVHQQKLGD
ncbi:hypothetical protein QUA40_16155 [Microcoleus sp. Pol11C3]|uniref:hypothetical protein n=1 Tax=Microcoleus sp. Pol11C3 TaxID=3055390 RepID=UPI002FD424A3